MWLTHRPSEEELRAFLARERTLALTYSEVGFSLDREPRGYDLDENRVRLGVGAETFERARAALLRWEMFPPAWSAVATEGAPIEPGSTVAVLFHLFGLWWVCSSRIVYLVDEETPRRRVGFAYGTLPGHVERGEELFSVEWHRDDSVWYALRAFSRPRWWAARLAKPLVRTLQRRFVHDSQLAMLAAVDGRNP